MKGKTSRQRMTNDELTNTEETSTAEFLRLAVDEGGHFRDMMPAKTGGHFGFVRYEGRDYAAKFPGYFALFGAFWRSCSVKSSERLRERRKTQRTLVLSRAPGYLFISVVSFFFSKKTVENVFMQAVHDMREEYFEALDAKRFGWARWIHVRWCVSIVLTFVLQTGVSFAKKLQWMWKLL